MAKWSNLKQTNPQLAEFRNTLHAFNERIRKVQKLGEVGEIIADRYIQEFREQFDIGFNFSGGGYENKYKRKLTIDDFITSNKRISLSLPNLHVLLKAINPDYAPTTQQLKDRQNFTNAQKRKLSLSRSKGKKAINKIKNLNTPELLSSFMNNVLSFQGIPSNPNQLQTDYTKLLQKRGQKEIKAILNNALPHYKILKAFSSVISKIFIILHDYDSEKWSEMVKRYDKGTLYYIIDRYARVVLKQPFNPETDSVDMINFFYPHGNMSHELLESTDERFEELAKIRLQEMKKEKENPNTTTDKIF